MFLNKRTNQEIESYKKLLKLIGSLSNLFADTSVPYVSSRVAENLFCRAFSANNLSRSDVSVDASVKEMGIGVKTFVEGNGKTFQKIAEFNKDKKLYSEKDPTGVIQTISILRNERLNATKRIHSLDNLLYHCITRKNGIITAYDLDMDLVDILNISKIKVKNNVIQFIDGINEYSFNLSKSTLYKRFVTPDSLIEVSVDIIKDPFEALEKLLLDSGLKLEFAKIKEDSEHIYLPLYSDREMMVPERSQLNQWNAAGRDRDENEAYIPIPAWIHHKFPDFFPPRDISFNLKLPNGEVMSAKVCQDGGKALMSKHNKDLGKWLLRDVMNLKEGELLTYDRLKIIGLDSVVIYKESAEDYSINFTKIGSFESFKTQSN
ncbi:MAG: NgoFVII family restriction endonuclease [bacterium]